MQTNIEPSEENSPPERESNYSEKVAQIKQEYGDLDEMRTTLGLSRRRICQLLLVDPSAWTRWAKSSAPPHVYRSLSWLIELRKIKPEMVGPDDLSRRVDIIHHQTSSKLERLEGSLEAIKHGRVATEVLSLQVLEQLEHHLNLKIDQLKLNLENEFAKKLIIVDEPKSKRTKKSKPVRVVRKLAKKKSAKPMRSKTARPKLKALAPKAKKQPGKRSKVLNKALGKKAGRTKRKSKRV